MFKASKAVGFSEGSLACVANVSLGLGSKEKPKNGILPARNWVESQNLFLSRGNSSPLNPTESLLGRLKAAFHCIPTHFYIT